MFKKISAVFLSGVILLGMSACGKKEKVEYDSKNLTIHVFCKDKECDEVSDYLDTVDKELKIEKHDISDKEGKSLLEKTLEYFDIEDDKTPITIINDKVILGLDDENKKEYEETIDEQKNEDYKNIIEKLSDGKSVEDIQESIKEQEKDKNTDDNTDKDSVKEPDKKPEVKPETKPEETPASKSDIEYIVKKGDYLSRIARLYNTSWKKIYEDNKSVIGDNPNLIKPGQKLTITGVSSIEYTVQKGDYLSKIASSYNTSWRKIYEDNKSVIGDNPNLIKPGQKLIINN